MSEGATNDKRLWILNYHFFMAVKLKTIEVSWFDYLINYIVIKYLIIEWNKNRK